MSVAVDAELPQQSCQGGFTALSLTDAFIISFFFLPPFYTAVTHFTAELNCASSSSSSTSGGGSSYEHPFQEREGREEDPLTWRIFNRFN